MTRLIDLAGSQFSRWTVLERGPYIPGRHTLWRCLCECGTESLVSTKHLRSGHSKSCGCFKSEASSDRLSAKLEGITVGRLTVIERVGSNRRHSALWRCKCSCGNETILPSGKLIGSVKTKSCGCLFQESVTTHGKSRTRTYRIWQKMHARCYKPQQNGYEDYGGRGIKVCDKWHTFEGFYEDMGDAPPERSIDRKDFNGNYCKENCRWATRKEQAQNTRRNRVVEVDGRKMLLTEAIAHLRKMARPL